MRGFRTQDAACQLPKDDEPEVNIRWFIRRDLRTVIHIENLCFSTPWDEDTFLRHLRQRNVAAMVVEQPVEVEGVATNQIVGYMIYSLDRTKIELLNIAVHPCHQGCYVGRAMIKKLQGKLGERLGGNRTFCAANVVDRNVNAQLFFKACGWKCTGIVQSHYQTDDGDWLDAYRFVYRINR